MICVQSLWFGASIGGLKFREGCQSIGKVWRCSRCVRWRYERAEVLNRFPTSKRTRPEMTQGRLSVKLMVVLVVLRLPFCGPIDVPTTKGFWTVFVPSQIGSVLVVLGFLRSLQESSMFPASFVVHIAENVAGCAGCAGSANAGSQTYADPRRPKAPSSWPWL